MRLPRWCARRRFCYQPGSPKKPERPESPPFLSGQRDDRRIRLGHGPPHLLAPWARPERWRSPSDGGMTRRMAADWPAMRFRWERPVALGLSAVIGGFGLALFWTTLSGGGLGIGGDLAEYMAATQRWIATGTPYLASEVAGPFDYGPLTFLHPPIALALFAPFLVLPTILWWAIPLTVVAWCVWSWRPALWTWPIIALALAYPRFHGALIVGNTDLWVWAGVAAGLRFGWPALVIVAKPSLVPLLVAGARHRAFWLGAGVVALACLPFGSLWLDWLAVVRHSPGDLSYSLPNLPWLLMPVLASSGRA